MPPLNGKRPPEIALELAMIGYLTKLCVDRSISIGANLREARQVYSLNMEILA
jgi:hypothetical protein